MKKNSDMTSGLNKSTKVTLVSCASFIALTMLILIFFVMFPITPSEKIMASIGRENVFNGGDGNSSMTAVPAGETTASNQTTATTDVHTSRAGYTTTKTVNIVITTGSGFLWNGRIPTGGFTVGDTHTTVADDPIVPTPDPGYTYPGNTDIPQPTEPYNPNNPNTPSTDVDIPNNPGTITTPVDIPDPTITPTSPPVTPTEPPNPPEPSAPAGGETQSE